MVTARAMGTGRLLKGKVALKSNHAYAFQMLTRSAGSAFG